MRRLPLLCLWLALAGAGAAEPKFTYPYQAGQLTFPQDEGRHAMADWPYPLIEWQAHYLHLTGDDGSRWFLFTTFVTFDPLEPFLGGKFPHQMGTLIDLDHGRTYAYQDLAPLAVYAAGHAEARAKPGNAFSWKGAEQPFEYDLQVAWKDQVDVALTVSSTMVKPPLAVGGTGFVQLPKGDSGYYSQTRLAVDGELTLDGVKRHVTGVQWIDRQWLGRSFAGQLMYSYDWWALQLDTNQEAILFRIWDTRDDTVVKWLLEINNAAGERVPVDDFAFTDVSPGWKLVAPSVGWDLSLVPAVADSGTWQPCTIRGTVNGQPAGGVAIAELLKSHLPELMKSILGRD